MTVKCDACGKLFEEQEGCMVSACDSGHVMYGREWWCYGCQEVVLKNSEPYREWDYYED